MRLRPFALLFGLFLVFAPVSVLADIADDDDTPAGDDDDSATGDDDDSSHDEHVHEHGEEAAGCSGCAVSPLQQDLGAAALAFLIALGAAGALRREREDV